MNMNKVMIGIFAVIVLYFMITVAMDISNTTSTCETITFEANETLTPAEHTLLLYPTPVLYNASDCVYEVSNYTYEAGGYTIGENIASDDYYATYDYDTSTTIWGIDFAFIGLLVIIGVGLLLAGKSYGVI